MAHSDPSAAKVRLEELLAGLAEVEMAPLDEQYRRLDEAQRTLGEILDGVPPAPAGQGLPQPPGRR